MMNHDVYVFTSTNQQVILYWFACKGKNVFADFPMFYYGYQTQILFGKGCGPETSERKKHKMAVFSHCDYL